MSFLFLERGPPRRRGGPRVALDPRRASHPLLLAFLLRLLRPLFRTSQPRTTGHVQVLRWIYPRPQPWRSGMERGNHRLVTGQYGLVLGADNSRVRRG